MGAPAEMTELPGLTVMAEAAAAVAAVTAGKLEPSGVTWPVLEAPLDEWPLPFDPSPGTCKTAPAAAAAAAAAAVVVFRLERPSLMKKVS